MRLALLARARIVSLSIFSRMKRKKDHQKSNACCGECPHFFILSFTKRTDTVHAAAGTCRHMTEREEKNGPFSFLLLCAGRARARVRQAHFFIRCDVGRGPMPPCAAPSRPAFSLPISLSLRSYPRAMSSGWRTRYCSPRITKRRQKEATKRSKVSTAMSFSLF